VFARSFDGSEAEIGDLKFSVNEASIAAATELLQEGERWFKNKSISDEAWRTILRNQGMDITVFKRGIPVHAIKDEWATLLLIVQKFITCEGYFGSMYMYHTRLLMNFLENQTLNLPYFLFNSLKKMAVTVQKHLGDVEPHLYHHGLIKILIEKELKEREDTWEQFLVRNFFEEPQEIPEGSSIRRSRRKRMNVETQIAPTQEIPAASTAKRSRRKRTVDEIQDTSTTTMKKTDREERLVKRKKKEIKTKKPIIPKGKEIIEAVHKTPSSSEEDHQMLSERLVYLQKQASISKKAEKGKQKQKGSVPQCVRRSSRLKGKLRKTQIKGPHFIDLGEETSEQSLADHSPSQSVSEPGSFHSQSDIEHTPSYSQQDIDVSPFQPDFEFNSPTRHFGDSPIKMTPEIDPKQQEVYDYIESLEKEATGPSTSSIQPHTLQDDLVQSLKQEVFELELLNRHIKNENQTLKEQRKLDKIIHDNTMLHLEYGRRRTRN